MLLKALRNGKSDIDAAKVLVTGATELRDVFPATKLHYVLEAYMEGLQAAFLVAVVAASVASVAAMGFRWMKLAADAPPAAIS